MKQASFYRTAHFWDIRIPSKAVWAIAFRRINRVFCGCNGIELGVSGMVETEFGLAGMGQG